MTGGAPARRSRDAWLVWAAGLAAYVVAIAHRSSFGVAGILAAHRFDVDATTLSLFVVVQLCVYAAMQLPVGMAVDRWGSRSTIALGSATMAVGQLAMSLAPDVAVALGARVLIGCGDAAVFVSAMRLVPAWFERRRVPLVMQLTGMLGQLGQVVTALPFAFALHRFGWAPAFGALAVLGVLSTGLVRIGVRDDPSTGVRTRVAGVADTLRHPGTWLGFWSHLLGATSGHVVVLMWGVPFLVQGQGLPAARASALLILNVLVSVAVAPVVGEITARRPERRSWLVLGFASVTVLGWLLVLAPSTPRPTWQLAAFVVLVSAGGPTALIGLDFAATFNPAHRTATAQGLANMGGFVAAVLTMLTVGVVLDRRAPAGAPSLDDYRAALSVVFVPLLAGIAGVLLARRRTRAATGVVMPPIGESWARYRARRR